MSALDAAVLDTLPKLVSVAESLVDDCYSSRRFYFTPDSSEKRTLITSQCNRALEAVDEAESILSKFPDHEYNHDHPPAPHLLYLRGKALNVHDEHSPRAEDCLTRAAKLYPGPAPVPYWNALAECFWKKGSLMEAKGCYESALAVKKEPETLRELSQLLRAMSSGKGKDKVESLHVQSLATAKDAVGLGLDDAESWYVLGMAHTSAYFSCTHRREDLGKGLKAYNRAAELEKKGEGRNPDLYFNRGKVHQYLENFEESVKDFEVAKEIDPSLPSDGPISEIRSWVLRVSDLVSRKGRVKAKKMASITDSLSNVTLPPPLSGQEDKVHSLTTLDNLSSAPHGSRLAIALKVIMPLGDPQTPPVKYLSVDSAGSCFVLSVYHLTATPQSDLTVKDTIVVLNPESRKMTDGKSSYIGVTVGDPKRLIINGKAPDAGNLAPPVFGTTTFGIGVEE